jgi:lysophospholipase L1-like esterase
LLARYDKDILFVKPDIISILIGVNDTWRRYDSNDPTSAKAFEKDYKALLDKIKKDLPKCKIMLMEPFVLPSMPDRTKWREDLDPKIQVVRGLAKDYAKAYLPLDGIFAQAGIDQYDYREMAADGVHPTVIGHRIIAREYMKALTKMVTM